MRPDWAIFQKFVLINFRTKVVQLFGDFREHYENIPLKVKAALVTFCFARNPDRGFSAIKTPSMKIAKN